MLAAVVMAACVLTAPLARADGDAESFVTKGIELRKEGRDAAALEAFRKAYALAPSPRIRAQIGLAEQALAQWLDAERDLLGALASADDEWIQKHAPALRNALSVVESHLGWLTVECDLAGARVRMNGAELGQTPLPERRVIAGDVALEIEKTGYVGARLTVAVASRQHAKVTMGLLAAPVPAKAAPETPSPSRAPLVVGSALLGVTVASLVVGTWFGIRALQAKRVRDERCETNCDAEAVSADREARVAATTSSIAFITGAVAGTAGVILILPTLSAPSSNGVAANGLVLAWSGRF